MGVVFLGVNDGGWGLVDMLFLSYGFFLWVFWELGSLVRLGGR